jgi:hypothetical protein
VEEESQRQRDSVWSEEQEVTARIRTLRVKSGAEKNETVLGCGVGREKTLGPEKPEITSGFDI